MAMQVHINPIGSLPFFYQPTRWRREPSFSDAVPHISFCFSPEAIAASISRSLLCIGVEGGKKSESGRRTAWVRAMESCVPRSHHVLELVLA